MTNGDFAGLGRLLGAADLTLNDGPIVRGAAEIERFAHETLKTYDGSSRTRHVTTNLIIEITDDGRSATSRSYYTVFQTLRDFPLQPIASGRYRDRFERREGGWTFVARAVNTDYASDLSHHVHAR